MSRFSFGLLIACLGAVALGAAQQQQFPAAPTPQNPIFRAGATLVAVDVYPTKDGKFVEGLTPADFEVKEDGKPQALEFFEFLKFPTNPGPGGRRDPQTVDEGEKLAADPHHRAFVVYLDTYHLISNGAYRMRQPVIDFLERTIGPTDYFAATTPELPVTAITFAQQTDTVDNVITNYWPKVFQGNLGTISLSKQEDWLQHCYLGRWLETKRENDLVAELFGRWRTDLVLTSLTALTTKLATIREERTNVLLFSDGWSLPGPDNSLEQSMWSRSTRGGPADANACDNELLRLAHLDYSAEFLDLRQNALRRNVAFFPISPSGMEVYTDNTQPFDAVDQNLLDTLRALATTTGGQAIVRQNELRAPLEQLSELFSAYYLLGYYTTNATNDGKYRTIDVKVKTPGIKTTARHGYVANPNPVLNRTVDPSAAPSPETTALRALATALGALAPLDANASLYAAAIPGSTDVAIVVEVPERNAATIGAGADVHISLSAAGGTPVTATGHIAANLRSALVRLPLDGPGPWQARIDVGVADGLSSSITVLRPVGMPLVGDPIVYRATPSPRSPLWPSAAHRFTRNDRLHLEWPESGPLDSHVARILDKRGQPIAVGVTLAEPPNPDHPALMGDVSLAPLAPGDYVIELVVGRAGAAERHLVAIRVGT
jgi:VWFA-related protein